MAEQGECSMEESSGRSPAGEGRGGRELGAFPCSSSRLHLEATGPPSVLQSKPPGKIQLYPNSFV
jgi:hypothetical protein